MNDFRLADADAPDLAAPADWAAANEEVLRLGLAWIDRRLAGEAAERARAAYFSARADMAADGAVAAIDRLARVFSLSPFDEDVLLLALAPAIDGSFGARFGAAQGRAAPAPATPHLVSLMLFGADRPPAEALRRLSRDGPLRRHDLIRLDEAAELPLSAAIHLPEAVRGLLCGFGGREPALEGLVTPLEPAPLPDALAALAEGVAGRGVAAGFRLQVIGPPRSGRRALAAAVLSRLGLGALACPATAGLAELVASLGRDTLLEECGVVLGFDPSLDGSAATVAALERRLPCAAIFVAEQPVEGLEAVPVLRLDPIGAEARAALWRQAGAPLDEAGIERVAEQFALGPDEIHAILRQPALSERGVWAACRDLGARDLEALATRIAPRRGWDDIVLADRTRDDLRALAAQMAGRARVHGAWGYRRILGRATGVSALFAGPSGVGKTMAAEVIAKALSLDLYLVDLARITSKYIGETEKNLRRIFDAAEAGGAVLFFDEADALFGKRMEVKDSHDRYANGDVSYLLQRMECFGGLAILATNLKSHLDTAFLRRLRMVIDFPQPDVAARLALWRRALPEGAPRGELDWERLARLDLSGGNITTIAANAAFRAAAAGGEITMGHILAAAEAEYRKLDRDASSLEAGR
jgi:hypothetical protein